MPFGGQRDPLQEVTPYRATTIHFDEAWTNVQQLARSFHRQAGDIRPVPPVEGLLQLPDGLWTIAPLQLRLNSLTQQTDSSNAVIGPSLITPGGGVLPYYAFHSPTDQPGAMTGASAAVASSSNQQFRRKVADGAQWTDSVNTGDIVAFPQPVVNPDFPLIRLAVGLQVYPANQGFKIRWRMPAHQAHATDVHSIFYFGGAQLGTQTGGTGGGEYALAFRGEGICVLYCRMTNAARTGLVWYEVDRWRYTDPAHVGNSWQTMMVVPYSTATGNSIAFYSGLDDTAQTLGNSTTGLAAPIGQPRGHLFTTAKLLWATSNLGLPKSTADLIRQDIRALTTGTGAGIVRYDAAQNIRHNFQLSRITYAAQGSANRAVVTITDRTIGNPFSPTSVSPLILYWEAIVPADCSVTGTIIDDYTGAPLPSAIPPAGLPSNAFAFTPNQGSAGYAARLTLTGSADNLRVPVLISYRIYRDGFKMVNAPGEWTGGVLMGVNIAGPESDPSHETAAFTIHDPADALYPLRSRDEVPVRIQTQYSADPNAFSVLFRGRTSRTVGTKIGAPQHEGLSTQSPLRQFPSSRHRYYTGSAVGPWQQLASQMTLVRQSIMLTDPVTKTQQPMYVLDLLRLAFGWCGVPDNQLDIPPTASVPLRFFQPPGDNSWSPILDPFLTVVEFIVKCVRDYLGWFVTWDNNAGPVQGNGCSLGMWRLLAPPLPPYTPIAGFVESPVPGKLPHAYVSYNAPGQLPMTFLPFGSWHEWTEAPEANAVLIRGMSDAGDGGSGTLRAVEQWWVNPASFTFDPSSPASPWLVAPQGGQPGIPNPDYLGYIKPLVYGDAAISGQAAVDWYCNRVFDMTCHAIKMGKITGVPQLLVTNPNDPLQTRPRPLRYYDPVSVTVDGVTAIWLVRNWNPRYTVDSVQYGDLELQAPIQGVQTAGQRWIP